MGGTTGIALHIIINKGKDMFGHHAKLDYRMSILQNRLHKVWCNIAHVVQSTVFYGHVEDP